MSLIATALLASVCCTSSVPDPIEPRFATSSVPGDADDCAIWIHPTDPDKSIVIGNDKSIDGHLYVWSLTGKQLYQSDTIERPVNIDVRYGVQVGNRVVDVVACGVRLKHEVRIYAIDPNTRALEDITTDSGIHTGHENQTYGLGLYQRPSDNQLFAFVSQKGGSIHQIALEDDGAGKVKGRIVRRFGAEDIRSKVEGICADDALGFVYCCDEEHAVLKYHADPNRKDDTLVQRFALDDGIVGDREGIGIYKKANGTGFIVLSSQGDNTLKLYRREGANAFVKTVVKYGSTHSDGVAVTSRPISSRFPKGFVVCHNDKDRNFAIYAWDDIE